jgi:hypothetical protein
MTVPRQDPDTAPMLSLCVFSCAYTTEQRSSTEVHGAIAPTDLAVEIYTFLWLMMRLLRLHSLRSHVKILATSALISNWGPG